MSLIWLDELGWEMANNTCCTRNKMMCCITFSQSVHALRKFTNRAFRGYLNLPNIGGMT